MHFLLLTFLLLWAHPIFAANETSKESMLLATRSITLDFYRLIETTNQNYEGLTEFKTEMQTIEKAWFQLHRECPFVVQSRCREILSNLMTASLKLDKPLIKLGPGTLCRSNNLITCLFQSKFYRDMFVANFEFQQVLELAERELIYDFDQAKVKNKNLDTLNLGKKLDQLRFAFELFLIEAVPYDYRPKFHAVWANFIHPIEELELLPDPEETIKNDYPKLNVSWNDFNMSYSAKTKRLPTQEGSQLMTRLHSNWTIVSKRILGK